MYQHPLIPLIFCSILILLSVKQCLARRVFLKGRLMFSFLLTFVAALILFFQNEISKESKLEVFANWTMIGIDVIVGITFIIFSEFSSSENQFNKDLFSCLDTTKFYVLVDRKNRVKKISAIFLEDLGISLESAMRKNIFDLIELKYRIFSLNGNDATKTDLKIYYGIPSSLEQKPRTMNLELHDDAADVSAYYFSEYYVVVFGKFRGRLFVGDKKGSESLVGMEKDLAQSTGELELIKSRFVTVLEKTKEGIFFTDLTTQTVWVNDMLVHSLSLSGNSLSLTEYMKNIHPEDLAIYKAKMAQVNNLSPAYSIKYRFYTGTRYLYVQEDGSRISNGRKIELCGIIHLMEDSHFEKTDTELDSIKGEPELLACVKNLFAQNKVFQIVSINMNSIKKLNDTYGRSIGNMALSEYIKLIKYRYVDAGMIFRVSGLDFIAIVTDYRKMDMLKNSLMNNEKILHVSAEYGSVKVQIEATMGITYSTDAKKPEQSIEQSKEALHYASNPQYAANFAYYKDIAYDKRRG